MDTTIAKRIGEVQRMTVKELQAEYAEVFGEATRSYHRDYLIKRIAWRLQANAEGGLSERARKRAAELANEADLRSTPPQMPPASDAGQRTVSGTLHLSGDKRLPMPGTILTREFKGRLVQALVLTEGFEHEGKVYRSLSAIARAVTGTSWNGYSFFGLAGKGGAA